MRFLAIRANNMLTVAGIVGAVNVCVRWRTAVVAFANNNRFVRMVDRNGDSLIEHVAFAVKQPALHLLVFSVSDDASV
ncbi:hypothetical protein D3C78_1916310 [compost metagenome]